MKKLIVALSICLVLLAGLLLALELTGENTSQAPSQTEAAAYTVQFQVNGSTLNHQEIVPGGLPQSFKGVLNGAQITGWTNSSGQAVDPFALPVDGDVQYFAVIQPQLTAHSPYLFPNAAGLLRPDIPLSRNDLYRALKALAAPGAEDFFPQIPGQGGTVTVIELKDYLDFFFDPELVNTAFGDVQTLTRSAFAEGMNQLLGRNGDQTLTLSDGHTIPADITSERRDAVALLEAAVAHTPADTGMTWQELELPTAHKPGFMNIDGQLYYVQEDRYLLRDDYVGTLYFDADGRYTSGDTELDQTVTDILGRLMEENPDAQGMDLLRIVFDHCHQNYTYRRLYENNPNYGETGWEIALAKDMFDSTKGNCYSYSAIFWALSRGLGYQTRAISGICLSDEQPHSWCIIELDGEDYIFDPQWQYNYTEREIFDKDMFQIPMSLIYIWEYQWTE